MSEIYQEPAVAEDISPGDVIPITTGPPPLEDSFSLRVRNCIETPGKVNNSCGNLTDIPIENMPEAISGFNKNTNNYLAELAYSDEQGFSNYQVPNDPGNLTFYTAGLVMITMPDGGRLEVCTSLNTIRDSDLEPDSALIDAVWSEAKCFPLAPLPLVEPDNG